MARIRAIKPEFFKHERLFDAEHETGLPLRIAFAGLWCVADREGRFHWRPRTLKSDILPFDDVDFARVLDALEKAGFIFSYEAKDEKYGCIPSFLQHQHVNMREAASAIPSPSTCAHVQAHGERKGKEQEGESPSVTPSNGVSNGVHLDVKHLAYAEGKRILGKNSGGVITRLIAATGGCGQALEALQAAERAGGDPMEYTQAIIRKTSRRADENWGLYS